MASTQHISTRIRRFSRWEVLLPACIFAIGIIITSIVFFRSASNAADSLSRQFEKESLLKADLINENIAEVSHGLIYLKAFFENSVSVEANEFQNFVKPYLAGNRAIKAVFALRPSDNDLNSFRLTHLEPALEYSEQLYNSDFETFFKIPPGTLAPVKTEALLQIPDPQYSDAGRNRLVLVAFSKDGRKYFLGVIFSPSESIRRTMSRIPFGSLPISLTTQTSERSELMDKKYLDSDNEDRLGFWEIFYPQVPSNHFNLQLGGAPLDLKISVGPRFLKQHYSLLIWLIWPLGLFLSFLGAVFIRKMLARTMTAEEMASTTAQALGSVERSLATTLRSIGDALITTDIQGRITRMNPVAEQLTGWTSAKAVGRPLSDVFQIINEDTRERIKDPTQAIMLTGKVVGLANHTILITRNGQECPIVDSGAPIVNESGAIEGAVLVFRDATEERAAQRLLEENERKLRLFYMNMNEGVAVHRLVKNDQGVPVNYRIIDINKMFENFLGLEKAAVVGQLATDLYKTDAPPYLEIFAEVAKTRTPREFTTYFRPLDKYFVVSVISYQPEECTAVFLDITERHKSDLESRRNKEKLASIFRAAPTAIGVLHGRTLVEFNDQLCSLLGYSREEIIGRSTRMLYGSEEEFQRVGKEAYAQLNEEGATTLETRWLTKDGKFIDIVLTHTCVDPENPAAGVTFSALDFTERKLAERSLVQARNLYLQVLDDAPALIWRTDEQGRHDWFNKSWLRHTDRRLEHEVEEGWMASLHPEDRARWTDSFREAFNARKFFQIEYRLLRHDGEYRHIIDSGRPFFSPEGDFLGYIGYGLDITDRINVENEAHKQEAYLQSVFNNMPFLMWLKDKDGRFLSVNEVFALSCGLGNPQFVLGKTDLDIWPRDLAEAYRADDQVVMDTGRQKFTEEMIADAAGTRWFETYKIPVLDPAGKIIGTTGFSRDITDRKRVDEALRKEKERAQSYLDIIGSIVVILNPEGKVSLINKSGCELLGYSQEEVLNKDWFENFLPERIRDAVRSNFALLMNGVLEPLEYFENQILTKDGRERTIAWHNTLFSDSTGRVINSLSSGQDVTDIRVAQAALKDSEERFRNIFNSSNDAIFIHDSQTGAIVDINEKSAEMYGCSRAELLTSQLEDFSSGVSPYSQREAVEWIHKARTQGPQVFQWHARHKSGRLFWTEISMHQALIGGMDRIIVTVRDITDRKLIEDALQMKTDELDRFFSSALDLLCIADTDGYFRRLNSAWHEVLGYELWELEGKQFIDYVHPDDISATRDVQAQLGQHKEVLNFSNRYLCKDGTYRWLEWRSLPFGNIVYASARDITERKRIEDALRDNEEKLRLMFETSPIGMAMCEMNGMLIQVNPAYLKIIGYTNEEALKLSYWDLTPKEYAEQEEKQLRSMEETGKYGPYEKEYIRKTGERVPVLLNGMVVTGTDGIKRIWSLVEDISDRKFAESALQKSEERLKLALDASKDGLWDYRMDGQVYYSPRYYTMLGYENLEFPATHEQWINLLHPEDKDVTLQRISDYMRKNEKDYSCEFRMRAKNGEWRWILSRGKAVEFTPDGKAYRLIGTHTDITDMKRAEQMIAHEKNLLKTLINNLPDSVYIKDLQGKKILTNRADVAFIGAKNEADVLGKTDAEIFPPHLAEQYHKDDRTVIDEAHPVINREEIVEDITGEKRWLLTSKLPLLDENGQVSGLIGIGRDITDRKLLENKLLNMAHYDTLTLLPNRTLFFERVNTALAHARRSKSKCALLFIDLDHFKKVNDTLGHTIGDELIKDTALKLRECLRESDTLARLGGDEFIIFLNDIDAGQSAQRIAERIREKFNMPRIVSGNDLFITASVGIAIYPDDGKDIEQLLKNADTAMYAAKDIGRNSYCFFNNLMNQRAVTRMQIERGLRDALIKEEFILYYQPVIGFKNGKIRGFEALLRWFKKEGGLVFPAEFIPVAEETGLIVPIGEWVLKSACQFNKHLIDLGHRDLIISVNMSVAQLRRKSLVDLVRDTLVETGLPPECLELELTESIFIESFDQAVDVLHQIRNMGVKISLDDFGTGFSSLSHLQRLPIGNLKMDRVFVKDIANDEVRSELAGSIIDLAHKLNLEVIAEGVETKEQAKRLKKSNCDYCQGFLLSKPIPAEQAIELLNSNPKGFTI